uniref:Uncharacterized protein n=1 Tax=Mycena chlorophos TaxID=658473 RepID=A0ABQ0MEF7_MYCCL|nr:predicted protein [Mycena chlorophos]
MSDYTPSALTPTERRRLVRSNRKLQILLGVAPQVIEAAITEAGLSSSFPPSSSPFSAPNTTPRHIPSQSLVDIDTFPPSRLHEQRLARRPSLYLHLDRTKTPSPLLPAPLTPLTPLSPTASITINGSPSPSPLLAPGNKDRRRQQSAKLARTLGENVAPELLSEPTVVLGKEEKRRLRRSASVGGLALGLGTGVGRSGSISSAGSSIRFKSTGWNAQRSLGRAASVRSGAMLRDETAYSRSDDESFVILDSASTSASSSAASSPNSEAMPVRAATPAIAPFLFPSEPAPAIEPKAEAHFATFTPFRVFQHNKPKISLPSNPRAGLGLSRSNSTKPLRSSSTPIPHRRIESAASGPSRNPVLEAALAKEDQLRAELLASFLQASGRGPAKDRAQALQIDIDPDHQSNVPPTTESPTSPTTSASPATPTVAESTVPEYMVVWAEDLATGKRRKEKEWSGEWNLDMWEVKQGLRSLR